MPTFPNLPTPTEFAFIMMIVGYTITIITAYHVLVNALVWAIKTLIRLVTEVLAQYAPRTLVKLQAWAMWPIWIVWYAMDKNAAFISNAKDGVARSYLARYEQLEKAAKAVDVELVRWR
jgi:hypothetical protein